MKRKVIPELLDSDAGTPDEVQASLADLRWFNRWFGGPLTSTGLLERVAAHAGHALTLLEVAAGAGYMAAQVEDRLQQRGIRLRTTLLDRAPSHMNGNGRFAHVAGDALALPFRDASFDVVTCNLFAHHLEAPELVRFVNGGLRVARHAVVINDLRRHALHYLAAVAGVPLYRSRLTRHDAPASVRRAYTCEEMAAILRQSAASRVEMSRHYFFRMGVIAWK